MTVSTLHPMTLDDARALLDSFDYNPEWSIDELKASIAHLPADVVDRIPTALRVMAAAHMAEGMALEAYRLRKFGPSNGEGGQ